MQDRKTHERKTNDHILGQKYARSKVKDHTALCTG